MNKNDKDWWRGAVIYQIYPRSFMDSNGDGIGDLRGISEKLEYVARLGVDGIWISPFFKSPMKDFGYDVADYREVDPIFGDLEDFDHMLQKAHDLGLKVIIDQVLSHTSDRHPWFQESRKNHTNNKADWYVWADPKEDGSPPNNWQSVFGGPSWKFDIRRGQYYLHNFLTEQPDLNIHNPQVREALKGEMAFWLDRGVDGFRLDAINFALHDVSLKDNPPAKNARSINFGVVTPENMQQHIYDRDHKDMTEFLEDIRILMDKYEDRMLVGEVAEAGVKLAALYTRGMKRLHTAYNFSLLGGEKPVASMFRNAIEDFATESGGESWPSWAFSNHDVPRVASRWHPNKEGHHHDPRLSKMLIALLCSLGGTVFIYQGEELGLPSSSVPKADLQDPWAREIWPEAEGRDICRTPMPWYDEPGVGFTSGDPWLPIADEHRLLAVARQETAPESTLHFTRNFLTFRKETVELEKGAIEFIDTSSETILAFTRRIPGKDKGLFFVFNIKGESDQFDYGASDISTAPPFESDVFSEIRNSDKATISLPPYGMFIGKLNR